MKAARQKATRELASKAEKNAERAFGFMFLWLIFFAGAPFSVYCLVQCQIIARRCREFGIPEPKDNRQGRLLALAPCIFFPSVAIILALNGLH